MAAKRTKEKWKPAHYKSISLKNFRGFKSVEEIPLAPLTFLVGPNSSGKSSISNAILFVTQSNWLHRSQPGGEPIWVGPLVDLGSFEDTVFKHKKNLRILISLTLSLDYSKKSALKGMLFSPEGKDTINYEFEIRDSLNDPRGRWSKLKIKDFPSNNKVGINFLAKGSSRPKVVPPENEFVWNCRVTGFRHPLFRLEERFMEWFEEAEKSLKNKAGWKRILHHLSSRSIYNRFVRGTQRVSSGRSAPERWYSRISTESARERWGGYRRLLDSIDPVFFGRKGRWRSELDRMNAIFKKMNIGSKVERKELSPYHFQIIVRDNITNVSSKIIDVGYGASQVFPVINACLDFDAIGPLFVEQPEIHLHPKAQGSIAELLGETSKRRQVVVETHSEHMINKIRLMVAEGRVKHEDVIINYVDRVSKGSKVHSIPILEDGEFGAKWPDGFFDERYKDTMNLLSKRSKEEE